MTHRAIIATLLVASLGVAAQGAPKVRKHLLVSSAELAKMLGKPGVAILHVGKKENYDQEHIPGARLVEVKDFTVAHGSIGNEMPPVADLVAMMQRLGIGDNTRVVIYEEAAGTWAARMFVTLDYLGAGEHAALLDGQLAKWKAEKRPLTTEAPQIMPAKFTPRPHPEVLVSLAAMKDFSWATRNTSAPLALLDSRPEDQFRGEAGAAERKGRIPGSQSLFWVNTLQSREMPVLKPVAEISKMFTAAGAQPGKKIVTYCHSGVQASFDYFLARYLGYDDVQMYDGSWSEWSADPSTEVETGASR
jgi:thiosulfate/3-mercaptopyruvate sulfurtransferase